MHSVKTKSAVEERFVRYILDNSSAPDGGTASMYHRAIEVLSMALAKTNNPFDKHPNVWDENDPDILMQLYAYVVQSQLEYVKSGTGLFSALGGSGIGKSYFVKRWCSAGVRKFAEFRATEQLEVTLNNAFLASDDGHTIAVRANKAQVGSCRCFVPDDIAPDSVVGKERIAEAKARINQSVFRKWIVGIYGGKCCVSGLDVPATLRASHIVAWSADKANRMNPSNGLCLSATYDSVFDRHLISFDDDYRMVLSKSIRDYCTKDVCKRYFLDFEGKEMQMPTKFFPDKQLLAKHRDKLV